MKYSKMVTAYDDLGGYVCADKPEFIAELLHWVMNSENGVYTGYGLDETYGDELLAALREKGWRFEEEVLLHNPLPDEIKALMAVAEL